MSQLIYPVDAPPELLHALGLMIFQTAPIARVFRAAGHDVPAKVEAEQAFILHRLVKHVLESGPLWETAFDIEYKKALAEARHREEVAAAAKVAKRLDQ